MIPMRTLGVAAIVVVGLWAAPSAAQAGVKVWNYEVLADAYRVKAPGPLGPIVIAGARDGTFSGAVAVSSETPIKALRATMGPLTTDGATIPASQVAVRYALPWGLVGGGPAGLDILLESPPAEVGISNKMAAAGVWVTVSVPAETKAGLYRGELTVQAEGLPAAKVPVELTVADWTIGDPQKWRTMVELMQSPDTLAMEYGLKLWSPEHWAMIARSFQLMRPTGSRVVYVPLLRCTNQGNSESMVRWVRQADGTFQPDFAIMDKYLDTAQKNLGDLRLVVFYVWDAYLVRSFRKQSFAERPDQAGQAQERWDIRQKGLTVTLLDPTTGATEPGFLPHYDDPASTAIWKPLFAELRARMKQRGLEQTMALGMITDLEPSKEEVLFLKDVSGNLPWVAHSHFRRTENRPAPNKALQGIADIGYEAHAYGLTYQVNPEKGHLYGWQVKEDRVYLDRFGDIDKSPLRMRQAFELNITGRQRGVGRLGADFWQAVKNKRGERQGQVFDRYPENHWRGLNIKSWLLAPGPEGPVATARFENLREGLQECEARIFLESSLLDPAKKEKIGAEVAARAQAALDAHQYAMWRSIWTNEEQLKMMGAITGRQMYEAIWEGLSRGGVKLPEFWDGAARSMRSKEEMAGIDWFATSGWQKRNQAMFEAAAEVAKRLK